MSTGLAIVGDPQKQLDSGLQNALSVSVQITGRTGEQACQRAIILMAESMASSGNPITPIAPRTRPVKGNPKFAHLMKRSQYKKARQAGKDMARYYKWSAVAFTQKGAKDIYGNDKKRIAKIGRRGLARRSWMWGLSAFGKASPSRPIAGVATLRAVIEGNQAGYEKGDRLAYLMAILPGGWAQEAETRAGNKIMHTAAQTLEKSWIGAVQRNEKTARRTLQSFIEKVSA
jgi:hypothetical protein